MLDIDGCYMIQPQHKPSVNLGHLQLWPALVHTQVRHDTHMYALLTCPGWRALK